MTGRRRILERAGRGDPVALTQALVAIPSVNPGLERGGAGEEEIAGQCEEWLRKWGYETELFEIAPGRWNVTARMGPVRGQGEGQGKGGGGRTLVLNGHLDTVGVAGMEIEPFGGVIEGEKVWGRGACDMKGGLAIILATAAALSRGRSAEERSDGELVVAFTADEEEASLGMQRFAAEVEGADGAVVCEPTNLSVMPAHKGFLWATAVFRGRAAHGSRPEEGTDAILHAAHFLTELEAWSRGLSEGTPHPLLGFPSVHAGTIRGGSAPSVYPDFCEVTVERRTLPGEDPKDLVDELEHVLARVRAQREDLSGEIHRGLFRPGTEVPLDSPLVQGLLAAAEEVGVGGRVGGMTAWVDAAFLNERGIPAVCFGPGSIAQAHSAREWVPVQELELGARILTRFASRFLAG